VADGTTAIYFSDINILILCFTDGNPGDEIQALHPHEQLLLPASVDKPTTLMFAKEACLTGHAKEGMLTPASPKSIGSARIRGLIRGLTFSPDFLRSADLAEV